MQVCSPSCHDTAPLRAWWEEDEARRERFYRTMLGGREDVAPARCTPAITRAVLRQHLESPSMWAVFPMQDILAVSSAYTDRPAAEETINDPTNAKHYWRFRLHVTLERLLSDTRLCADLQGMLLDSGRCAEADLERRLEGGSPVLYPPV